MPSQPNILAMRDDAVCAGSQVIPIARFPELLRFFRTCMPQTLLLETTGQALATEGFRSDAATIEFVRSVCDWGGRTGNRVFGQVSKLNSPGQVSDGLRRAARELRCEQPDLTLAMSCVNCIKGLGQVSYASKHLRFLAPALCVTLDSNLASQLGGEPSPEGFAALAHDCASVATTFNARGVPAPLGVGGWRAADVEVAVFTHLNPTVVSG